MSAIITTKVSSIFNTLPFGQGHIRAASFSTSSKRQTRAPQRTARDKALDALGRYVVAFVVSDSESMRKKFRSGGGESRWDRCRNIIITITEFVSRGVHYDEETADMPIGTDVYFMNSGKTKRGMRNEKQIRQLFNELKLSLDNKSSIPMGKTLQAALNVYIDDFHTWETTELKPVLFIILIDGVPTDKSNCLPEDIIVNAAYELDQLDAPIGQVLIQIVQIGEDDDTRKYLKALDESLRNRHKIRDMVDITPHTPGKKMNLFGILTEGIYRRMPNHMRWTSEDKQDASKWKHMKHPSV